MIVTVQLPPDEQAAIMRDATALAADLILADALLTREQAAKMLGMTTKTLNLLPVLRVKLGGAIRYRRADILSHIQASLER